MGRLINGQWHTGSIVTSDLKGSYQRKPRTFREVIAKDHQTFQADTGRYHLYVSHACPWAHRTLIYRSLKQLEEHISVSVVHPDMLDHGWVFDPSFPDASVDHLFGSQYLYQLYQKAQPDIDTSVTVPILWDKQHNTIVNNESSEIIRIFNSAFNTLTGNQDDYYPSHLRTDIDQWNEKIYHHVNNGVYRTGFAKTQSAYNEAVKDLFLTLDELDNHLSGKNFLVANQLTEADLRLLPTLLRFDLVYYVHFKTSLKRIGDYPNLSRYTQQLYNLDAVRKNTYFSHIKRHYYYSHENINPYRIVPMIEPYFMDSES